MVACSRSSSLRCVKKYLTQIVASGFQQKRTSYIQILTLMRKNVRAGTVFVGRRLTDYSSTAHSLEWYRFIGRILGKALYEGILIDVAFAGFFLAKVRVLFEVVLFVT